MGKLALSFLMLFLTSCNLGGLETSLGNTPGIPSVEAPQDEEPSDGDTDPQEPQPPIVDVPITEQYPFLEEQSFWDRAAEIASIPSSKSCSNTRSYAYFGIVRLVHSFMIEGPFALFPFESDIEYIEYAGDVANGFIYLYAYGAWYVYDNTFVRCYDEPTYKFEDLEVALYEKA